MIKERLKNTASFCVLISIYDFSFDSVIWLCFFCPLVAVIGSVGFHESDVLLLLLCQITRSYNYSICYDCDIECTVNLVQTVTRDILYNNIMYL